MTDIAPILAQWDGDGFMPRGSIWKKRANEAFVVGAEYLVEVREPRSKASHDHYFATIHECWLNLPEHLADVFPTEEKLRKHALIKAGFRDERSIVCRSKAEAAKVAAFVRPMDDYGIVVVIGTTVTQYTAKSQSMKAMGKVEFQKSKNAVLDVIAALLGMTAETLGKSTEAA